MRLSAYRLLAIALLVWLPACQPAEVIEPEPGIPLVVGSGNLPAMGLLVTLRAKDSLRSSYQSLYAEVLDLATQKRRRDLTVTVVPIMHMQTMSHSAPVEQPQGCDAQGQYPFQVVFIMPESDMSWWEIAVTVTDPVTGEQGTVNLPVNVTAPQEARVRSLILADDSSKAFLSLVAPTKPTVGINPFEIAVHQKVDNNSFPPLADLQIEIEPTMPSMGHGSPNNVMPLPIGEGHYKGQVNFTMDGWWEIQVRVFRNEQLIGETKVNLTFSVR